MEFKLVFQVRGVWHYKLQGGGVLYQTSGEGVPPNQGGWHFIKLQLGWHFKFQEGVTLSGGGGQGKFSKGPPLATVNKT